MPELSLCGRHSPQFAQTARMSIGGAVLHRFESTRSSDRLLLVSAVVFVVNVTRFIILLCRHIIHTRTCLFYENGQTRRESTKMLSNDDIMNNTMIQWIAGRKCSQKQDHRKFNTPLSLDEIRKRRLNVRSPLVCSCLLLLSSASTVLLLLLLFCRSARLLFILF